MPNFFGLVCKFPKIFKLVLCDRLYGDNGFALRADIYAYTVIRSFKIQISLNKNIIVKELKSWRICYNKNDYAFLVIYRSVQLIKKII